MSQLNAWRFLKYSCEAIQFSDEDAPDPAFGLPFLERKQVAFPKTMPLYEKFMDELLSFPSSKNDDMVDALTLALTYRQRILAVANYHRRQNRRHLPQARGSMQEVRITGFGERPSGVPDSYFERTGISTFSRFRL